MSAPSLPSSSWGADVMLQGMAENTQQERESSTLRSSWCGRRMAVLRDNLCCFSRDDSEVPSGLSSPVPESARPDPGNPMCYSVWGASKNECKGTSLKDRKCIHLVTGHMPSNVDGALKFVSEQAERRGMTAKFVQLPYNGLDRYEVKEYINGPLILCHSLDNRRCSITNVMDALYDVFLEKAKKCLGKYNVAVVIHDYSDNIIENAKIHESTIETLKHKQPSMFKCANLVFMTAKLANYDSLPGNFKHSVEQFIDKMREQAF